MKILIIEDDLEIRNSLHDMLEIHGHAVTDAADGIEGVRLAKSFLPDLIFCDIAMPAMGGYEVISTLRQHPPCCEIPFIFLTARANRADQRHGMSLGADDYITKPFSEKEIFDAVSARTRRQQPSRNRIARLLAERQVVADAPWSHELMTPLCGILGGLELLEVASAPLEPGELKNVIAIIRAGAERQHALARKLVLYYELERLKAAVPHESVYSCDAVATVVDGAARAAEEERRADDLVVRCEPGSVPVSKPHLLAVVAELVSNACRFSKSGQPVTVAGIRDGKNYRIEVVDQGVGMTAEQRTKVDAFTQFGREKREQQGLGLGLAIVRGVAELSGGELTLETVFGGKGLKATFELPCT
jgi:two-component system sensor histidine kinase/response regulator